MNVAMYERLVLCAALHDKVSVYRLAKELPETSLGYGPGGEQSDAHRLIFRAIVALYQEQSPVDVGTVAKKLGTDLGYTGGELYLAELSQAFQSIGIQGIEGLEEWAKVVDNAGRLRQLSTILERYSGQIENVDQALSTITDVDMFFGDLLQDIGKTYKLKSSYHHIAEAVGEFESDMEKERLGTAASWIPVGWQATKKYRLLPRDALVTLMGLSSIGKSQLLAQFLLGAAIQLKHFDLPGVVVFNTYEMLGKRYAGRMASCLSGVNLLSPQLQDTSSDEYNKLKQAGDFIRTLPILYDDGDMTSSQIITQTLGLQVEYGGVHVIGVDYSELVPDKGDQEEQRVSRIFRNCHSLSRKLGAAVVVVSQVSGEAFTSDTRIAGAWGPRYSKAGWHASDIEIELYNPPQMRQQGITFRVPDWLPGDSKAYCLIHKNKNGPTGFFSLEWTPGIVRFSDPALTGYGMGILYENMEDVWGREEDF